MKVLVSFITLIFASGAFATEFNYMVPTSEELKPFATFKLQGSIIHATDGLIKLNYQLPAELVGENYQPMSFVGRRKNDGQIDLRGDLGKAKCIEINSILNCDVEYEDLDIDLAAVELAINNQSANPQQRLNQLEVAKLFSGEPVGILQVVP